ncbi:hypothetical protein [Streptomyces sp. NPDC088760]|uniref:hypothetical protein n=1 Tax=Streptomyces sp. NPDC088760 TaxID=3365890 RepID=UPI0037F97993
MYEVLCDLNNDDWVGVVDVLGNNAGLVATGSRQAAAMEILGQHFGLIPPKEAILAGTLPAAIIDT